MILWLFRDDHIHLCRINAVARQVTRLQFESRQVQLRQFPGENIKGYTCADERTQRHVTADSREGIKVGYSHVVVFMAFRISFIASSVPSHISSNLHSPLPLSSRFFRPQDRLQMFQKPFGCTRMFAHEVERRSTGRHAFFLVSK